MVSLKDLWRFGDLIIFKYIFQNFLDDICRAYIHSVLVCPTLKAFLVCSTASLTNFMGSFPFGPMFFSWRQSH